METKEAAADKQERFDFDGLWKEIIARFWRELLRRCLPALYAVADLSREPEFLDKELHALVSEPGEENHEYAKFVDALLKIFLKDGSQQWVLLHIEVQGSGGEDLPYRMFTYCFLILRRHHVLPAALAIMTAPRPRERLGVYELSQFGTHLLYSYNYLEVYRLDDGELLSSDNPFDLALYAAKKLPVYRNKEAQKFAYLRDLTRLFFEKGWSEHDLRDILKFIARLINLKDKDLQEQYFEEFEKLEGKNVMAVRSFIEEHFIAQGRSEGIAKGIAKGTIITLASLVKKGLLSVKDAAMQANMSEEVFLEQAKACQA